MIPRYSRPELDTIWSDATRLGTWLELELAHLSARERRQQAPEGTAARIRAAVARTGLDPERVLAIEAETRHDVIAFLTHVEELAGPDARFLHVGLTSSDVLDSALALQAVRAGREILAGAALLGDALKRRALEHRRTAMIGRSHGIHAEVTTFGLALASHWAEVDRGARAFARAVDEVGVGKLSGAVGTFGATLPGVEEEALAAVGLTADPVSTQVVARDRLARYVAELGALCATVERLAVNVRHWQRTEVREAEEPFAKGQKGSSAMPHKRNPVLSENVTGLCRYVRSLVAPALESVVLWHERDISHSSVERLILPDSTTAADFLLRRMARVMEGLVVYPETMARNLALSRGLPFSGHVLLALVDKGMERQAAYVVVQRCALPAWDGGAEFRDALARDPEVTALLTAAELDACFDVDRALRHVDVIFARVFGAGGAA